MKKIFLEPEIEISRFEIADLLTTSGYGDTEDDQYTQGDDRLGWF